MKTVKSQRILAIILTLTMLMSMMLVFAISGNAEGSDNKYTLKASSIHPFAAGAKADADYEKAGTDKYFTIFYSEKTKVETNEKTFDDGVGASQRFSWGAKTEIGDQILNAVKIKTQGSATVKLWWVGGDAGRAPAIFDAAGNVVAQYQGETVKNDLYITELEIPSQGVYYIGNLVGSNYFYQIEVIDSKNGTPEGDRADWAGVSAPVITSAADNGSGKIEVSVNALVGHNGADELLVSMYLGDELVITRGSVTEGDSHTILFTPANSGNYTFKTELVRNGEDSKVGESASASFVYVLAAPYITSVTSAGGGSIQIKWNAVHEAESYNIYQDGVKIDSVSADKLTYTASGLTIGQEYSYVVSAVRGSEELNSASSSTVATQDAKREWGFTVYGPSTSEDKCDHIGSVNDDGKVTVYSEGNGGKIQPTSTDGLAFYYTAVPTEYNFTLRATVTVDSWTLSNGQEGFGLLVTDRLGENGDKGVIWNNSYLAGSTKIEYKYNGDTDELIDNKVVDSSLKKYSMKLGIGIVSRTGVTPENLALFEAQDTDTINKNFVSRFYTLERQAADVCPESGTYNIIGNYTSEPAGTLTDFLITEYTIEIQKNNSGYFITYYAPDGSVISQKKYYDPDALSHLDPNYVYAGFFAARNARVTFSNVEFTTILASEDAPREYPPMDYITPTVSVNSGNVTTKEDYELIIDFNLSGNLTVKYEGNTIVDNVYVDKDFTLRNRTDMVLNHYGENEINIEFTPDPYQWLPEFTAISSDKTIYATYYVQYNKGNYHKKTIYISPSVKAYSTTADGSRENPFDIFTALENACPGQTLILMEGTYKPGSAIKIQRGMDGTADAPIRLIADPEAKTRPVIDFEGLYAGFTHGGDYWYFYGFDITGSSDMQKGFQVSGSYNVLDQLNAYENGNTGIQICRLAGGDLKNDWPSYNLILNCTSYRNYDSGFEDADGFAAKLTVGEGNVFDGCIAYNNADDGWDLYAKVETGAIGAVTIRNCISYDNGHVPGAGSKTGNGNGFKMGGESISGKHVLENSIAFNNLAKGIDCNSCPDIIVINSISFNNGSYNVALYTNQAANTAFVVNGLVSFRTDKLDIREELKSKGNQLASNYVNDTAYYWNETKGYTANKSGEQITADMFVSLEFTGWERRADGTIDLKGFLELKDNAPANASKCKLGGQASYEIILEEDLECTFGKNWIKSDKDAHWHVCECGNKSDIGEHSLIWIIDRPVVGNQTGSKHQECTICGYKKSAITIYPEVETPEEPEEPENSDNNEPDPDQPDNNEPGENETPDNGEKLSFFERIWQAILNFFRNLFGLNKDENP